MAEDTDEPVLLLATLWFRPDGGRELYGEYLATIGPVIEAHTGRPFVSHSYTPTSVRAGDLDADLVTLDEFPSEAVLRTLDVDLDYQRARSIRDRATVKINVVQLRRS